MGKFSDGRQFHNSPIEERNFAGYSINVHWFLANMLRFRKQEPGYF
ncbi:hypothetical protein SAMN05216420_101232 [Nitrosospira sp. Nl5]|nr:hypothetical protein SAMN05216420_101232 [Nitrosospira sp. Nl5]